MSLLSAVGKLYRRVLIDRIRTSTDDVLEEDSVVLGGVGDV